VEAAGLLAVDPDALMDGVRELVDEVRLEVLVGDGTRLVVLIDPLGRGRALTDGPGTIAAGAGRAATTDDRERRTIAVRNESRRAIRVSSHFPFDRANARLVFDRDAAIGFRLDVPAGSSERWAPGEAKEVGIVRYGGSGDDGAPAE
jgi:urease subunit gamma/beta